MNIRTIANKSKNLQKKADLKRLIFIKKRLEIYCYPKVTKQEINKINFKHLILLDKLLNKVKNTPALSDEEINELNQLDHERNNGYKLI